MLSISWMQYKLHLTLELDIFIPHINVKWHISTVILHPHLCMALLWLKDIATSLLSLLLYMPHCFASLYWHSEGSCWLECVHLLYLVSFKQRHTPSDQWLHPCVFLHALFYSSSFTILLFSWTIVWITLCIDLEKSLNIVCVHFTLWNLLYFPVNLTMYLCKYKGCMFKCVYFCLIDSCFPAT